MFSRLSLTYKMLGLTVMVGILVWFSLDVMLSGDIERVFRDQLNSNLERQAREDRFDFDEYFKKYYLTAKLLSSQKRIIDYVSDASEGAWKSKPEAPLYYYNIPPPWYPKLSVTRALAQAKVAILTDREGRVREVYNAGMDEIPNELINPAALMRQLSHSQSFMTNIGGAPYVVSSVSIVPGGNEAAATLMLASPVDSEFLASAPGHKLHNSITALLKQDGSSVMVSSMPDVIPAGADVETLKESYVMTGGSFFDYAASDLRFEFVSFVPTAEVDELVGRVVGQERLYRLITAAALIGSFALIMLWVTGNIAKIADGITTFSRDTLGVSLSRPDTADELRMLEEEFSELMREVLRTRESLKQESEEKFRLAEQAMAASLKERELKLLESIMELLGVGIMSVDDGRLKSINNLMERFAEEFGGLDEFGREPDVQWGVRRIIDREGKARNFTISSLKTDDEEHFLLVQDVTEIKKVEETLRESEARARAIADTAMDAIVTIDHQGLVTYWNPAAENMFGYSSEEMTGTDVHELLTPEKYKDSARKGLKSFLESGTGPAIGITRTLSSLRRDGTEFPIELSLSVFQREGRWNAVGVIRDITERVQAEEAKDSMFHMLTHDIKGPLSIIYGYCELIMMQGLPQEAAEMLEEMFKAAKRISGLIDDMLSLSKLESGTFELEFEKILLEELVREVALDSENNAGKMDVEITINVLPDTPEVYADRKQLGRAVGNLIGNAVNYNKKGGSVTVTAGPKDRDGVWIKVSDTGAGIPKDSLPHIFDKYFRSKNTASRRGTGLGLAIVKAAVESHGGSVTVESEIGEGTTFTVEIPVDARRDTD